MKRYFSSLAGIGLVLFLTGPGVLHGQTPTQTPTLAAPTLFRMAGTLQMATGEPRTGVVVLVATLYNAQSDTTPLWSEAQTVTLDQTGRYSILVGSSLEGGVPREYFLNGSGLWLGVAVQGETEQPRVMLISVPYALKAVDADTLAGKTAADFVLAENWKALVSGGSGSQRANGTGVETGPLAANVTSADSSVNSTFTNTNPSNNAAWIQLGNVGGTMNFGMERSTGGAVLGGTPGYASVLTTNQATPLIFGTNAAPRMWLDASGNLGVGTSPTSLFHLGRGASDSSAIQTIENAHPSNNAASMQFKSTGGAFFVGQERSSGGAILTGATGYSGVLVTNQATPIMFGTNSLFRMIISSNGNVGIGTAAPTAKLDVVGNINVSGNINAKYQDVAEWVETTTPLEPGTVVIVDPAASNRVLRSPKANDTRVAGAVSKQPGLLLGERTGTNAMVAQSGRVRVKVDATYGAVRVGDLLVTSPTPGYAMRARPVKVGGQLIYRAGTILGKALEALPKGKGEILVLLTLQ